MSSLKGKSYSMSHVFDFLDLEESYLYKAEPLDQEEEESPFRVARRTS